MIWRMNALRIIIPLFSGCIVKVAVTFTRNMYFVKVNKTNLYLKAIKITILTINTRLRLNFGMTKVLEMWNHNENNTGRMSLFLLALSGKKLTLY